MTVSIIISGTSGGDSLADTVDLGSVIPDEDTDFQDMFIRHDAVVAAITDVSFYATRYTGSNYLGSSADADFIEIMGWGDAVSGGFTINQVPPVSWVEGTQFATIFDQIFKNGYGDIDSQLILRKESINVGTPPSLDGVIPVAGEAHVQVRIQAPASIPDGAGYRAIQLVMAYSATS